MLQFLAAVAIIALLIAAGPIGWIVLIVLIFA